MPTLTLGNHLEFIEGVCTTSSNIYSVDIWVVDNPSFLSWGREGGLSASHIGQGTSYSILDFALLSGRSDISQVPNLRSVFEKALSFINKCRSAEGSFVKSAICNFTVLLKRYNFFIVMGVI
jgi:hypothetical protein